MREGGQDIWWRKSRQLAATTLSALALLSLTPLVARAFGRTAILGLSPPYLLFAVAAPIAILLAIFWFARRQRDYDHRYDVTGD